MKSERDTTRIVRSWLEGGSTAVPDRVLDDVLSQLHSTPQRRSPWSPRRLLQMKFVMPIAGAAVVVLVTLVLGRALLPGGSNVGGPAGPPATISGQVTYLLGDEITVDVDASANGSSLSGGATVSYGADQFTIGLHCARMFDDTTWMLGGEIDESTPGGQPVGTRTAVIVREGSPQQVSLWFDDPSAGADCPAFLNGIPNDAVEGLGYLRPVKEGEISLPNRLGG
jgi:hypothetical protein